ncbi:tRNA(Ile)-lysidine synthase [Rhizobium sp. RU33A]|uniref:tRNA lysidine(34) synthetase TilS n=1 Tax=Rhizobium sp. RU33A TaxID=1907413 RepID=UPI000954E306|nr:tRNA lysidine(34) synthetase TilS [Rhizobium sp. RU33A]SIQ27289.1 tRNA(Ile)-lysidine synthase [Rhizobium sp. RU33A]
MSTLLVAGSYLPELSPEAAIQEFLLSLNRPMRLLVAVSGGSDSLGLLLFLKRAIDGQTYPHRHILCAATIDHGLRPEAAKEAGEVAELCRELGISHRIERWTGEKPKSGLSAAARAARYRLLTHAAGILKADAIVTGHTLDDQIETVAMRADRSADAALGLSGMAPATLYAGRLWILRPFLRTRRPAIRSGLAADGRTWIDDPSNDDPRYERVRTRRAAPTRDAATIEVAARQRTSLSAQAADWLKRHATAGPGMSVSVSLDTSGHLEKGMRDHALGTLVAVLGGKPHRPGADSLARLSLKLDESSDFRLTLSGSLVLRRRDRLYLVRERRGLLPLSLLPGAVGIWDGRYTIVNSSDNAITVTGGPATAIDTTLPGSIRSALQGNAPQIIENNEVRYHQDTAVTTTPRLSLYADFMPCFDQPLADTIAALIGAKPSASCPI